MIFIIDFNENLVITHMKDQLTDILMEKKNADILLWFYGLTTTNMGL